MQRKEKTLLIITCIIIVSLIFGISIIVFLYSRETKTQYQNEEVNTPSYPGGLVQSDFPIIPWTFDGNKWMPKEEYSECNNNLDITTPIDISLATSILYPGQLRGGNYKSHGGFAFDALMDNKVIVKLPEDAILWRAARYIESGELQYMLDFMTSCGITYRFDHLLTLSTKVMDIIKVLPEPTEDSRTTLINPVVNFTKGEIIAIEIGHRNPKNIAFDFGVYDLKMQNEISKNIEWASEHQYIKEYAYYAICWLDKLEGNDKFIARSLPARGMEGKESDYCN